VRTARSEAGADGEVGGWSERRGRRRERDGEVGGGSGRGRPLGADGEVRGGSGRGRRGQRQERRRRARAAAVVESGSLTASS
jgi:hypothetical protein